MLLALIETVLVILLSITIWKSVKKPSNYPPGPWGFPFIGSVPAGFEGFADGLVELRKQHNDIVSWKIGTQMIVVIFDFKLAKEVFQHPEIAYKPDVKTLAYINGDRKLGIILSDGIHAQNNRKFALRHFREFGTKNWKLLTVAQLEADKFVQEMKKQAGLKAPVPNYLSIAFVNNVWQMVGGKRFEYEDEEITNFCDLIADSRVFGSKLIILDIFPWIKKVLPVFLLNLIFKYNKQSELSTKISQYFKIQIDERLKNLNENPPKDFIESYLLEMKKQESNLNSTMSIEDLIFCLSDLFEGAMETTSISIHWAILYLAKYPQIQSKIHEEIAEVLPNGASFFMEDKIRLPYTEAFITELLRHSSVAPSPPRAAHSDVQIDNFLIPKGSFIVTQGMMMHYDSRYFESPEEFRPERFLNSEGKFQAPKEGFVPFGFGNRVCIGEAIARMEFFVFITKLVQNFHFEYPPGEEFNLEGVASPFLRPPKGSPNVILTLR